MDVSNVVRYLQIVQIPNAYAGVVAIAVMMYDYCLTFHLEVKLVWLSSWSYTKILFLLTRYVPMVDAWILLYTQIFPNPSLYTCSMLWPASVWLSVIGMNCAEIILAIRTWAVWRRDWRLGIALAFLVLGGFILECVSLEKTIKGAQIVGNLYPGSAGCLVASTVDFFWFCFVALAVVEGAILLLMSISAFRMYRSGNSGELANVIHRDGILFYLYFLCLTLGNVLCIRFVFMDILIQPQNVLYSVLTSRIVFNIRNITNKIEVDTQGKLTELHETLPMQFCAAPNNGSERVVEDDFNLDDWTTTVLPLRIFHESSVCEGTEVGDMA